MIIETILICIFLLILAVLAPHFPNKNLNKLRALAKQQFLEHRSLSHDPRFHFDGRTAEIVRTSEEVPRSEQIIQGYSLTCYARNSAGEYFMFVSNENSPPFFKHIEPAIAKIALGKHYVASPRSTQSGESSRESSNKSRHPTKQLDENEYDTCSTRK